MRLLVAAGASGGGVYPALAVLQELDDERLELLWVGGEGGMEEALVTRAGFQLTTLPAAGLHAVGLRSLPGNLWQLFRGYQAARKLIREWQPDVIFFTGGFVAAPVALAGRRVPTAAFVPDMKPGRALRLVSLFADRIAVVSEELARFFRRSERLEVTGYPLRKEFTAWTREQAREEFGLAAKKKTLLVFGGSKGAQSINHALLACLPDLLAYMQVIHVTGEANWEQVEAAREDLTTEQRGNYFPYPYLHETMGAAFAAADLALARAGASTLGELPAFGLPAILVPLPHETNMVQHHNAAQLRASGGALVMDDADLLTHLHNTVMELMIDDLRREQMASAMRAQAKPQASQRIAEMLRQMGREAK